MDEGVRDKQKKRRSVKASKSFTRRQAFTLRPELSVEGRRASPAFGGATRNV